MESETPSPPVVNGDDEKLNRKISDFPAAIPDNELEEKRRRFRGYIENIFARSRHRLPNFLMKEAKARFAKARGLSADHMERVSRALMRTTDKFSFVRTRLGRSFHILIIPKYRSEEISTEEVRRRLVRAIGNYVAKSGAVRVDRKFLAGFHRRYGLLPEQIFAAWASIYFVPGCVCQWRGRAKQNFLSVRIDRSAGQVSSRQNAGRISSLREKVPENSGFAEPDRTGSRSSLRSQAGQGGGDRPLGVASPGETLRATLRPATRCDVSDDQSRSGGPRPRANIAEPLGSDRVSDHVFATPKPLHVCNRWVSLAKLRGKVNFLAFQILRPMHEKYDRVRWWPTTGRNFVERAIFGGYLDSEICAAYRLGLEETQASAVKFLRAEREKKPYGPFDPALAMREPSQAVHRAWLRLWNDTRSDEERWAAIFNGGASPQRKFEKVARPARAPNRAGSGAATSKTSAPVRRERPADPWEEKREQQATIEIHLARAGLTLADLLKLSRPEQAAFIAAALAAQKRKSSQNGEFVKD